MPAGQHTQSRAITSDSTKKDSLLALQKSFQSSCLRPNIAAGPMSLTLQDYPLLTDIESDPAAPGEHHVSDSSQSSCSVILTLRTIGSCCHLQPSRSQHTQPV
jgi:hypothetical protein